MIENLPILGVQGIAQVEDVLLLAIARRLLSIDGARAGANIDDGPGAREAMPTMPKLGQRLCSPARQNSQTPHESPATMTTS